MMLEWALSFLIVFAGLVLIGLVARYARRYTRASAVVVEGQTTLKEAVDVSVRLVVDANVPGGLRAGTSYRSEGHLRLMRDCLVLATNHGRVLELTLEQTGTVRAPGPRMMILEGMHPSGRARVRAELILDDESGWQAAIVEQRLSA